MNRFESVATRLRARPVGAVFVALALIPVVLAVFSFRQPVALPDSILTESEVLSRLLVYASVAAVRSILFEPLGLDVLFSISGLQQALVLLAFYYGLSVAVVAQPDCSVGGTIPSAETPRTVSPEYVREN